MATILVAALRGETPSNILIYGKTGTGKTASAKFVSQELEKTSKKYDVPCEVEYINCEVTDTQYRVLAQLANTFIDQNRAFVDARIADLSDLRAQADDDPNALEIGGRRATIVQATNRVRAPMFRTAFRIFGSASTPSRRSTTASTPRKPTRPRWNRSP